MKIAVIGTGYVGLPTGVGFAELGHDVVCIDNNLEKINDLNNGKITLFEEGLEELFKKNAASRRIKFTIDMKAGLEAVDFIIIAVGTPPHPITKEANMKYIYAAVEELAPFLSKYVVIANKSTVPVGTGDKIEELIRAKNSNADVDVISMPEFLREGLAIHDFFNPDRIVVGTNSERAIKKVNELYAVFRKKPNVLFVERRTSELIKYASNAFLAMKIHYINELADFCEKIGANVHNVAKGIGLDPRIGDKFLNPGPGYGGSCFPKDTNALAYMARNKMVNLSLVEATIAGNDERKAQMALRILDAVNDIKNPRIAIWGLAFKDGTDDVRESPALQIVQELVSRGTDIIAYDPKAIETARVILGDSIHYAQNAKDAAQNADALAVLTEWQEFRQTPLYTLQMKNKRIIDLRNIIDPGKAEAVGFCYRGIGR